jgi:hypothetical protein
VAVATPRRKPHQRSAIDRTRLESSARIVAASVPSRTRPSTHDRVRCGPYVFHRLPGSAPLVCVLAVALPSPMLRSEPYDEQSVLTEPLAQATARRTATRFPSGACWSDASQQASRTLADSPW